MSFDERTAHRNWHFPPVRILSPEEITQKNHHLRPQRLRRSSATHHTSSSGQHSLAGEQHKQARATPARTLLSELRGLYDQMILLFLFHLIHATILILLPAAAWTRIIAADLHFFLKRDHIRSASAVWFFRQWTQVRLFEFLKNLLEIFFNSMELKMHLNSCIRILMRVFKCNYFTIS